MALSYYITARRQLNLVSGTEDPLQVLKEVVRAAFVAGVRYVQVREMDLPDGRLARFVEELRRLPEKKGTQLLVNERLDIATAVGADGVHLPSDSLPLSRVRGRAGLAGIVGISCHTEDDVEQAAQEGASYVLLGPVFPTPSKTGTPPLGLPVLETLCRRFPVPILALGGVTTENAADCVRAGAAGVAGIRLFQQASDCVELCRYLDSL